MLIDHRASGKPERRWRWSFNESFLIGKPGNPMMERWRLIQTPLFGIYLHFIYREDLDPIPHDHPWRFWSFVLHGGYKEHLWPDSRIHGVSEIQEHKAGSFHHFPLRSAHRIISVQRGTVTLVIVGRKLRTWGFYANGRFIEWQEALSVRPTEGSRSTGKYKKSGVS